MFTIYAVDTDYSEVPTGYINEDFDEFVAKHDLEVVERGETSATVQAEWGNGEGFDTYTVEFES